MCTTTQHNTTHTLVIRKEETSPCNTAANAIFCPACTACKGQRSVRLIPVTAAALQWWRRDLCLLLRAFLVFSSVDGFPPTTTRSTAATDCLENCCDVTDDQFVLVTTECWCLNKQRHVVFMQSFVCHNYIIYLTNVSFIFSPNTQIKDSDYSSICNVATINNVSLSIIHSHHYHCNTVWNCPKWFWILIDVTSTFTGQLLHLFHSPFYLSISVTSHHSFTPRKLIFPDHYISTSNSDQSFISCITIFRLQRLYRNMSRITSINQRPASSDVTEDSTALWQVKSLSVLNSVEIICCISPLTASFTAGCIHCALKRSSGYLWPLTCSPRGNHLDHQRQLLTTGETQSKRKKKIIIVKIKA